MHFRAARRGNSIHVNEFVDIPFIPSTESGRDERDERDRGHARVTLRAICIRGSLCFPLDSAIAGPSQTDHNPFRGNSHETTAHHRNARCLDRRSGGGRTGCRQTAHWDKLISERLTHDEMAGGEIDRRIMDLIYKNYMVLDLDRDWLDKFRNRTDRGDARNVYYGIGKVLDAGSLFAQYTGDPQVAQRTQYIMDQLRASRDPDGYLGFWNVEPNNYQNIVNWILHEQEYVNLALVRNYRTTGIPNPWRTHKSWPTTSCGCSPRTIMGNT
jgi:hypothetical protein